MQKSYVLCVIKRNVLLLHLDQVGKMCCQNVLSKRFPFFRLFVRFTLLK